MNGRTHASMAEAFGPYTDNTLHPMRERVVGVRELFTPKASRLMSARRRTRIRRRAWSLFIHALVRICGF